MLLCNVATSRLSHASVHSLLFLPSMAPSTCLVGRRHRHAAFGRIAQPHRFSSPWSLSGSVWAQGVVLDDDDDSNYYDPNSSFHPSQSNKFLPTLDKAVFQEG